MMRIYFDAHTICTRSIMTTPKYLCHEDIGCILYLRLTSMAAVILCSVRSCMKTVSVLAAAHYCSLTLTAAAAAAVVVVELFPLWRSLLY